MTTAQDTTATTQGADDTPFADRHPLLRLSERLRAFVDLVGRFGTWMVVPMVLFTIVDVVGRKISWLDDEGRLHGVQIFLVRNVGRMFESTMLQEAEWHFHAALFALVLGYGYIHNTHVRVDLVRETLEFRKKAWLEFIGITVFLIPFCICIAYFAFGYVQSSYAMNEVSASTVGLTHRWLIKSVLLFGLIMALVAGISVWLQVFVVLFLNKEEKRFPLMTLEWPEEAGSKIEGKERIKLEGSMDALAAPDLLTKERTSKILTGG